MIITFFLGLLSIVVIALLMCVPTMLLWNWLMPYLFGLPTIGLTKALGINFFSGVLFKNNVTVNK